MVSRSAAAALALALMLPGAAQPAPAPKIPNSELPGRERERFLDQPVPPVPRIELHDGRPKAAVTAPKEARAVKKRKGRARKSRR